MTNDKIQMTNKIQISNDECLKRKYDLEDRTLKFAKDCIALCKRIPRNSVNSELKNQLIRSACSVGANYREANDAVTKKDFYYRIGVCRREVKETKYWIELAQYANSNASNETKPLIEESLQLVRIFAAIGKRNKR